jgi:hypothetical protein
MSNVEVNYFPAFQPDIPVFHRNFILFAVDTSFSIGYSPSDRRHPDGLVPSGIFFLQVLHSYFFVEFWIFTLASH